jgi:hypothetical protein
LVTQGKEARQAVEHHFTGVDAAEVVVDGEGSRMACPARMAAVPTRGAATVSMRGPANPVSSPPMACPPASGSPRATRVSQSMRSFARLAISASEGVGFACTSALITGPGLRLADGALGH